MKTMIFILSALVLVSCGKSNTVPSTRPQVAGVDVSHCPYGFPNAGLCAALQWDVGPSADQTSSFTVRFWNAQTSSPTGPTEEPAGEVSSFIQMQCCGSQFYPTVTQTSPGVYSVTQVRFLPGKWKVFVQIKGEQGEEKIDEDVDLTR